MRLAALEAAGQHYRAFLHRCRQYELLSPPAAALAKGVLEGGEGDSSSGSNGGRLDPAALRQSKIEKFKRWARKEKQPVMHSSAACLKRCRWRVCMCLAGSNGGQSTAPQRALPHVVCLHVHQPSHFPS